METRQDLPIPRSFQGRRSLVNHASNNLPCRTNQCLFLIRKSYRCEHHTQHKQPICAKLHGHSRSSPSIWPTQMLACLANRCRYVSRPYGCHFLHCNVRLKAAVTSRIFRRRGPLFEYGCHEPVTKRRGLQRIVVINSLGLDSNSWSSMQMQKMHRMEFTQQSHEQVSIPLSPFRQQLTYCQLQFFLLRAFESRAFRLFLAMSKATCSTSSAPIERLSRQRVK